MQLRFLIAIPTYHNHETWRQVVESARSVKPQIPLLIIDDGSFPHIEPPKDWQQGVSVIRHEKNRGKGAAIQTAMQYALNNHFTHLITMDADGQHDPEDLSSMISAATENPFDLVIGVRDFSAEQQVPNISKFGRWFSNFWVRYQTGQKIADSQSGFRVYPLFVLQDICWSYKRFEFELEVLAKAAWTGTRFIEVPVRAYYLSSPFFPKNHKRVSHFDKCWDNVRITKMNFYLVVQTLFKLPVDLRSWLLGTAVFLLWFLLPMHFFSSSPVTENMFRFFILSLFCFVTRISAGYLLLAFVSLMISSLFLFGCIGMMGVVAVIRAAHAAQSQKTWTGKLRGGVVGHFILRTLARYSSRHVSYALMFFVVPYFYLSAPGARRASRRYLRRIFKEKSSAVREIMIFRHFFCFASILVDRLHQSVGHDADFEFENDGGEELLKLVKSSMGGVIATAHFGALDIVSAATPDFGLNDKLIRAAYVTPEGLNVEKELAKASTSSRFELPLVDQSQQSILQMREWLRKGQSICLMADRPLHKQFELVPFLGGLGLFDAVPFRLAYLSRDERGKKAPLLLALGIKKSRNQYCFFVRTCHHFDNNKLLEKDTPSDIYEAMQFYASTLEDQVRRNPMQWFNFFSFWGDRPVPPKGETMKGKKS